MQKSSTNTVAVASGAPFRDQMRVTSCAPVWAYGALIENLAEIEADVVFVKNIDNVAIEKVPPSLGGTQEASFGWGAVFDPR